MQMFYFHRISKEPPSTGVLSVTLLIKAHIHTDLPHSEEILHQEKTVNGCFSFRNIQRNRPLRWVSQWIFTQRSDGATSSEKCSWFDTPKLWGQWEYFTCVICFTVLKDLKKKKLYIYYAFICFHLPSWI